MSRAAADLANAAGPRTTGSAIVVASCRSPLAPATLAADIKKAVAWLEKETEKKFGDPKNPLLVSVRSGARDSMPGMMDTILNLGLNDKTVEGLKAATNNGRFAWDSYRRFVQMYGDVVMGVQKRHENEHEPFDEVIADDIAAVLKVPDALDPRLEVVVPGDHLEQLGRRGAEVLAIGHEELAEALVPGHQSEWGHDGSCA